MMQKGYRFIDDNGTFTLENPDRYTGLYFPIAGEKGIKSAVTPNLGGDAKTDQNHFILAPTSVDDLRDSNISRNFWCRMEDGTCWSATGMSAKAQAQKFTEKEETTSITAGLMWQSVKRISTDEKAPLSSMITSFVTIDGAAEIMHVVIRNEGNQNVTFTPVAAVPIYGRSASNQRDHRHVTSLLHRIKTTEEGVLVHPTLSFDERGHLPGNVTYFVAGSDGKSGPEAFYPIQSEFTGEGGTFLQPHAVIFGEDGVPAGYEAAGKEAMGGLKFKSVTLRPEEEASFTILIGMMEDSDTAADIRVRELVSAFSTKEKTEAKLEKIKKYWLSKLTVRIHTGDDDYDNFLVWICFQPILRRIYGCSFLPHHDYGKGGRGWRDLWQDCLALLLMDPSGVREMLLSNFAGVRSDGTNATIIGEKQGEFIADRNNITRVWMDHGMWPLNTMKLYMDQTGDVEILEEKAHYFKDKQICRGTATDEKWNEEYGCRQKTESGDLYEGTVAEHLLLENLCAFYDVGEHGHMLLRGADWNDALDMASERGESVAFTCGYAGNLKDLAIYLRRLSEKTGTQTIEIAKEMEILLSDQNEVDYENITEKRELLAKYNESVRHNMSGEKISLSIDDVCKNLEEKSAWIGEHVRRTEWIWDGENGWFNSYYDNHGRAVEGFFGEDVRMMLTGQVFAIMSGVATNDQVEKIMRSVDKYLLDPVTGGYRLNTDFHEVKSDLGRMFGFAFGEKENGAVFSHMDVMYANALCVRGYKKEGDGVLRALAKAAMNFEKSRIYPGIPEYFDGSGRGLYHYLTGAASWYMMTRMLEL